MLNKALDKERIVDAPFGNKENLLKKGMNAALLNLNKTVLELQAKTLKKAYESANKNPFNEKEFAKKVNKGLDEARKKLLSHIAKEVRVEVIKATGIQFDKAIVRHLSKHLAEETSASVNDFVHLNKGNGSISFIGASDKTSHHQEMGGNHVADRIMYSHHFKEQDDSVAVLATRQQVRVPSLAVKKLHKVTNKLLDEDETSQNQSPSSKATLATRIKALAIKKKLSLSESEITQITNEYSEMHDKIQEGFSREKAFNYFVIEDTTKKMAYLQEKYQLGDVVQPADMPQAFVYNLYTSINKAGTWDLLEKDDERRNKQRQSAEHILAAAHAYNREHPDKPLCLVQNMPVNGWGHELSINATNPVVVNEAALMTQIASLHTVYDALTPQGQEQARKVFKDYDKFRNDKEGGLSFYNYIQVQKLKTLDHLETTKKLELSIPSIDALFVKQAQYALASMFQGNAFSTHNNGFTYQALSVFVENASIGGCKSANERAQAVNGRASIFDFISLNKETREQLLRKYLSDDEATRLIEAADKLACAVKEHNLAKITKNLNALYGSLNLEGFQAVVSFIDQGGHAKLGTKGRLPNTNNAETIYTNVEKAASWQCHKGLIDNVLKEFCGIQKTSIKAEIKMALTVIAAEVGCTGIALGIAAAFGVAAALSTAGILLGVAAAAGLVAYATIALWSWFTREMTTEKRFNAIQDENETLIRKASTQPILKPSGQSFFKKEKAQPFKEDLNADQLSMSQTLTG